MDHTETKFVQDEVEGGAVHLNSANRIRNKTLRRAQVRKDKRQKNKLKKAERKKRKDAGLPKNVPKTIDNMREKDDTMLVDMDEEDQLELNLELERDELSSYFQRTYEPKVLITFSDNPHQKCRIFGRELTRVIPNSVSLYRNRSGVKKMVKSAIDKGFTDIIVINEDRYQPNGMLVIHLPDGPTAHFRLSNVKLTPELKVC
ncbi:hypothetical protein B7P43_G03510 [Cryptotermes secundus]|uniref:Brix domain-containing protein n=1 Tax=Cryptotermes secundus TaxID=105785 RepID=A0A2J7RG04_9NEOP|nr:hypothetical protein B7P43_G03510 [Cryptotermes secundus]